ncbi:MAG: hypothetical protein A2X08_09195 [Bacteroidetes bacterium GWA2_32_17]|nr:MAG: hypothetical protein A2X08_09195 [Bacteroidetes bacterium GWA2_32_17]
MDIVKVKEIVLNALNNILTVVPVEQGFEIDESTLLLAEGSIIDSLTLVSLIVDIETTYSTDYNIEISLSDDRAMTREISPFLSVSKLVDYIYELISEK